jgi:hypothetical protein
MSEPRQIMHGISAYVESRTNPKEVVFGAGNLIRAEETVVEVLEMKCLDHEQELLL